MKYFPTGAGEYDLDTIILDLNGTLAVNGELVNGVEHRIQKLHDLGFKIVLFTGDQRGTAAIQAGKLGIELVLTKNQVEKQDAAAKYNPEHTVAIGNARIDIGTFANARLKIATLQAEGIHTAILAHVDLLMPSINNALDLLIDSNTFNATMRI